MSVKWWNPATWIKKETKARSYEGAGKGRRHDGWTTTSASANSLVGSHAGLLRQRSRDLLRNNAYAAAAIRALTSNIVGDGIKPKSNTGDQQLDAEVDRLWKQWERVASGTLPVGFYGLQALAVRSFLESGEVLLRRRRRRRVDALPVPMQIQILEADQLDATKNEVLNDSGARIVQGVEFSPTERRVAFHILRNHPGETVVQLRNGREVVRVFAEDIAHLYEPQRPGQVRGVPWLAPAIRRFRDLDDYEDAELVRKKVEACVAAFVIGDEEAEEGIAPKVEDSDGNPIETLEPGLIAYTRGGKQVVFNQPHSVGGYDAYKRAELQSIAAAVGMTYELLSGDLSKVNFSSIRAGLIEFRRMVSAMRANLVIPMMCDPVWRWFIEAAIADGSLPKPIAGTTEDVYRVKWTAPRFEEVDREKDAKADREELANAGGFRSQLASKGIDFEEWIAEEIETRERLSEAGISFPWLSGGSTSAPMAAQDEEQAPEENDEQAPEEDEETAAA